MSRGRGFTDAEIDSLLDVVEEILPIGPNDWDRVAERHCTYYPGLGRTRESLKRKFASLYNHKKPTGDPTCPAVVRRAKRVWELIKAEMDISDGEREDDHEEENEDEDNGLNVNVPTLHAPGIPPLEDGDEVDHSESGNGEDPSVAAPVVLRAPAVPPNVQATTPVVSRLANLAGTRIRTPRHARNTAASLNSGPGSSMTELMQFMLMRSEAENRMDLQRRQEREEQEDRRRREREEADERYRRERDEAEDRRERRMERQMQSQSEMMQVFMMGMMEGRFKRKRDNDPDCNDDDTAGK